MTYDLTITTYTYFQVLHCIRSFTMSFLLRICSSLFSLFFFFNDTATTEIYTLSLHDALPIYMQLGYFTPPVGMNLFIASFRFKKPVAELYIATIPFFFILLACVLVITFWPWLSLVFI